MSDNDFTSLINPILFSHNKGNPNTITLHMVPTFSDWQISPISNIFSMFFLMNLFNKYTSIKKSVKKMKNGSNSLTFPVYSKFPDRKTFSHFSSPCGNYDYVTSKLLKDCSMFQKIWTNWRNQLGSVPHIITGDTSPWHNTITGGRETAIYLTHPTVSYPQPIHSTGVSEGQSTTQDKSSLTRFYPASILTYSLLMSSFYNHNEKGKHSYNDWLCWLYFAYFSPVLPTKAKYR